MTEPTPKRKRIRCGERNQGDAEPKGKVGRRGLRTNLVVELWQLHLHLFSLKQMVLCLFTHWRNQIELSGHRVGLLSGVGKREGWGGEAFFPFSSTPPPPIEWGLEGPCEKWESVVGQGKVGLHTHHDFCSPPSGCPPV